MITPGSLVSAGFASLLLAAGACGVAPPRAGSDAATVLPATPVEPMDIEDYTACDHAPRFLRLSGHMVLAELAGAPFLGTKQTGEGREFTQTEDPCVALGRVAARSPTLDEPAWVSRVRSVCAGKVGPEALAAARVATDPRERLVLELLTIAAAELDLPLVGQTTALTMEVLEHMAGHLVQDACADPSKTVLCASAKRDVEAFRACP